MSSDAGHPHLPDHVGADARAQPPRARAEAAPTDRYGEPVTDSLSDFLRFAGEVQEIVVRPGRETFFTTRPLQLAAEALLQKLGECVNRLPAGFREDHPQVPWRAIRGMRNLLAHDYDQIDYKIVWETASRSVPDAAAAVRSILGR